MLYCTMEALFMVHKRAWAEINLANLTYNLKTLQKHLLHQPSSLMGIVKADAYGHGAIPVAKTLFNNGVKSFGVAICEEGIELRQGGIHAPILVMGFTPDQLLTEVVYHDLTQTVFHKDGATALASCAARVNKRAAIHIKIDTGMSRLGFLPSLESIETICNIAAIPHLEVTGIYTHLATSDAINNDFMFEQLERFKWVTNEIEKRGVTIPVKHIANSGAFSHMTATKTDSYKDFYQDHVRLGIMMYGYPPSLEMASTCAPLNLKPVMRLISRVSMVKNLPANVGISYGHLYKTKKESTIAVLPIGYADGYPRRLSNGGKVLINGKLAPIAGAICMDQCMVDVTGIDNISPGDPVIMMGEAGICADNLAEIVGTISYEILCGVGKRMPRVYV